MRRHSQTQKLRSIPLFANCSPRELAQVDALGAEYGASAGEILVREGVPGRESYIILEGDAIVTVGARVVARLRSGDFFGEMALLGRRNMRTATVTALTPMRLLVIDPRELGSLIRIEGVAKSMLAEVADRLSKAMVQRPA